MKATSKLISVVLILALCLSIFTVSAFAEPKIAEQGADGSTIIIGSGTEEEIEGEGGEDTIPAITSGGAPEVTKVGPNDDLVSALKENAVIELTGPVKVNGSLTVPAGVTIDLAGNSLAINGNGEAAISASGVTIKNGTLAVTGAVTDIETNITTGFGKVVSGGVVFRNVAMNLDGDTVLGNVSVVSGTFNKDVSANIAEGSRKAEPAAADADQAVAPFVVEEIPAAVGIAEVHMRREQCVQGIEWRGG